MTFRHKHTCISNRNCRALVTALVSLFVFPNSFFVVAQSGEAQQRRFGVAKTPASAAVVDISAVRNLNEEDWLERLEIEVKNLSNKPIYFLQIHIYFPRAIATGDDGVGRRMGISLEYGRYDLMKAGHFATSEDLPIKPGQRHVFKVPDDKRNGLRSGMAYRGRPGSNFDSVVFRVYAASFGDGTGFRAGGIAFP